MSDALSVNPAHGAEIVVATYEGVLNPVAEEYLHDALLFAQSKEAFQAAQILAESANVISQNPATLQLQHLQMLVEIAAERNSTTIFPIPIDTLAPFIKGLLSR